MPKRNLVEAINRGLLEEMERDPAVVILGEDVGREGGVFRVTDGLQARFGSDRVIDTPLAESGIVGTAFGMAVNGLRPVAEIQFEGFLAPAMDQIMSHIARIRTRSRGRFTSPLVIRSPFGGGIHAPEHHSDSPEAIFIHTPGIKVVIPASPYDAKGLIKAAIRDADPILFFEPKRIYRAIKEEVPDEDYTVPIGKAKVVREGNDITLISWGAMVRETLRAAEMVERQGVKAEVIDLRTLSPMDEEVFLTSVKKTGRAVIIQEAPRTCGLGAEISARIQETSLLSLEAPVERITGFDTIVPLLKLENHYLPTPERIVRGIRKVMAF
ncbi:MAG: alpha-ketoacid dehydrogenase subunit beta [Deltaproteobacteria bacterium]|nr:alpha-ketoacid dehydrogenase subunit beta [Deltaproteobacteria bacterium]